MSGAKSVTATFAIKTYALTVSATNGSVAKSPDLTSYDSNAVVQLTATPATGYTFTGWTGDASGTTNPISVTMSGAKSVTATFAIKTYALTVSATNGSVAKSPDQESYDSNAVVQLTATPATGYTFTGWSGAATGTTNPVSVTMDAAKTVTANFAINMYALTVNATNGTVAKSPDAATYAHGSSVELTATPATGYTFTGWSGDASGTTNPITVTMSGAKSVTANFAINMYALTVNATNGTVAKSPDAATYAHGTSVELTATPATGYTFTGWSGAATGTTNPVSVTMDAAKTVTANFAIKTYALTVSATNGSVAKNPDLTSYDSNAVVQLTATPATGYTFTGWTGDASGTTNPISVTMSGAKSVTATFAIKTYALTVSATNGSVAKSPDLTSYDSNAVVQLTATPATGYTFTGWTGDASGTTNPISVTMSGAKSVTATFAIKTYALTVSATNGSVAKSPDLTSYDSNAVVQLTATPATGYTFTGWTGDASGTTNPISVTMSGAKSVTATFAIKTYALTVSATNGSVAKSPDLTSYDSNAVVQLTATPATGYTFTGWTGDVVASTDSITVTMDAAKTVTATFAIKTYALTVSATNGSVAKSPDLTSYDSNAVVQLTATPATGYTFTGWTGDASGTTNPISVTMSGAKSITATFAIKSYTLTIVSPNGTVVKTPDLTSYDSNSVVGVKVTPAVGYSFIGWTGDIESSTDSISVTMNAAKNITATFAIKKYILTTTAVNGTVVKSPNLVSYDTNSVVELTATPASGYAFNGWTGDASGTTNPISVTMNAAKNITANFIALNVVELVSGWNMFSLNVIPQDSNATAVFGSMTHLVIVKSGDGKVFWPEFGINTIGTVHLGQAYQVYTNGADVISVTGTPVVLSSTPIPLASGWNMLAYLPKVDMPIVTALAGIVTQIKIVKNNAGEVYWPDYGIDDIGIMQVGQGYMMNMKTTGSLTYPSGLGKQAHSTSGTIMPKTRHFVYTAGNTGNNATVLATRIVQNNKNVSDSSEVGVYNASGNLVGSGVVMNGKAAFSIWGDNPMTKEKDGLAASESFTFKLWRSNGEVNNLVFVGEGADKGFVENGLIVGAMSVRSNNLVTKFALANAYPNPFRGNVRIAFDVASINGKDLQNVEINVFDVRGVLVQQIVKGMYKAGHYTVAWDGNDHLGSNMYIIQMKAEEFSQKIKLFRVK